jgi:hypothetical protein
MPFFIHAFEALGLAVGRSEGRVLESEIKDAIDFAFGPGRLPLGVDRIVYVEPTADLREIDSDTLHRIQAHIMQQTGVPDGKLSAFRSILVAPSPFHRPIVELYKAIWDSHRLPGVEFSVVTTIAETARLLALPKGSALLVRPPTGERR